MTRLALALLALLLVVAACGSARIRVAATMPSMHGTPECVADTSAIAPSVDLWAHFAWASLVKGGASGHDSTRSKPGELVEFGVDVPDGNYRVMAWASAPLGGPGCRDTIVVSVGAPPGPVALEGR